MSEWSPAAATRLRMLARERSDQETLVSVTGISRATLQRILSGKTDPGPDRLRRLVDALETTIDYILNGNGEASIVEVGVYEVEVAAGPGRIPLDEASASSTWPFAREWLVDHFGDTSGLKLVRVSGDSQEPELRDGDAVMIDVNTNKLREGMHVVRLDDALMIKRIQLQGATVSLKSANPRYDPIVLDLAMDAERFAVIGKAVWASKLL